MPVRASSLTKTLVVGVLAVVAAVALSAADLSGVWEVDGDVQGHPVKYTCTLEQQGETLAGTARFEDAREVPVTGTVDGVEATWTFEVDSYVLTFTGTLGSEDRMKGTIEVQGASGDFTATHQP